MAPGLQSFVTFQCCCAMFIPTGIVPYTRKKVRNFFRHFRTYILRRFLRTYGVFIFRYNSLIMSGVTALRRFSPDLVIDLDEASRESAGDLFFFWRTAKIPSKNFTVSGPMTFFFGVTVSRTVPAVPGVIFTKLSGPSHFFRHLRSW